MIDWKRASWTSLMAILLLGGSLVAHGQNEVAASPSPENLLRRMSEELKKADGYRFHAEIQFDDVLISGQKLQYSGAADLVLRRPDSVYIDYRDDLSAKRFWYDGKTATLLEVDSKLYSQVDLPGDIDTVVDELRKEYGLTLPLADLISSDLFKVIEPKALAWGYIGVHDVEGTPAHHIAIVGENADLQLWIQKDGGALPLKLVITYNRDEAPQYQAVMMDWKLGAKASAGVNFEATLPKGAQKIEFLVPEGLR